MSSFLTRNYATCCSLFVRKQRPIFFDDRLRYFAELRRALRPEGRVAIIDWQKRRLPIGPPPSHKLTRQHVVDEMKASGYELIAEPQLLPYQYFLIFRPGGDTQ